jgi:electron transfer flavoprotein beta subunit
MVLNIVVLIKQIIDIDQLKTDTKTGEPITQNIPLRVENLSKNAIEAAVQIKEKNGGKVTGIIFGTDKSNSAMKEAYAMGVDDGYIITGYLGNNPALTASIISKKILEIGDVDCIILGNQSADSYTGLLPGLLSSILKMNLLGNAVSIEVDGDQFKIKRVMDEKDEVISAQKPSIISVTQEINQPRLPPVLQIMAAGRKPINITEGDKGNIEMPRIISNIAPKSERKRIIFEDKDKGIAEITKVIRGEMK